MCKGEEWRVLLRLRGVIGVDINGVVIFREMVRFELVGVVGFLVFKIGCCDGYVEVY